LKTKVYTFSLLTGNEEASITVTRPNNKNSAEDIKRSPPGYGTLPKKQTIQQKELELAQSRKGHITQIKRECVQDNFYGAFECSPGDIF